ncbi:MAG: V-type ATP synthase subunit F [bacterium]|nr:V-type ATP synthase subunit F [bacterium]
MSKVATIGEKDVLLCFKGMGAEVFPVTKPEEALIKLRELAFDSSYGIILITESIAMSIADEISRLSQRALNIILIIPGHKGSQNTSLSEMKKLIERAVGIDLISKGDNHSWEE